MELTAKTVEAITRTARKPGHRSFYLYDTGIMRAKITQLKAALPKGIELFYAMKANPHPAFIRAAREGGTAGIEVASLGEIEKAVAGGFAPNELIFTSPGKTPDELRWSVANRIRTLHVDSLTEAYRLNKVCEELGQTQDILIRVNPNFHMAGAKVSFSGDPCKLGVDEDTLAGALPQILALPRLKFRGLHVYAASGILKAETLLENCKKVFSLARQVESQYPNAVCSIIDFGGGFGIDYGETGATFALDTYARELTKLIAAFGFDGRTFIIELGRYLTADSGWYCTEILDIKTSLGKKQVICAGGAHHFRRPTAIENHPLTIIPMRQPKVFDGQENVDDAMVFIGGPLCNTADKLAQKDIYVRHAEIGDIAVFGLAGAYGLTMSHVDFLSHPHPPEVMDSQ